MNEELDSLGILLLFELYEQGYIYSKHIYANVNIT